MTKAFCAPCARLTPHKVVSATQDAGILTVNLECHICANRYQDNIDTNRQSSSSF